MSNFSHLLSKHGVLANFNIARKVRSEDIKSIQKQLSSKGESNPETFLNKLKTMISLQENQKPLDDIPGLIINRQKSEMMMFFEKLPNDVKFSITEMSNKFSIYAASKKLDTPEILIAIQLIFNQLGISTDDLKEFNKKFKPPEDLDDDDGDDDDEDEDEDED